MALSGSSTFRIATPSGSVKNFLISTSPSFSPGKALPHNVRVPLSRLTSCSSSLMATEVPRRDSEDILKMELAFTSLFFSMENSFDDGDADSLGVDQIIRAPWDPWGIIQAGREEEAKQGGGAFSTPLFRRDASLRYANVMWFKGAYNVEIICREDEREESIVRRFRQAVSRAGVVRECQRRRYRETKQDTIKRKQRLASFDRKRQPRGNGFAPGTENAWKLSRSNLKPVDHSKKKKSKKNSRRFPEQPRFDATKKTDETDDDYWGFVEEAPIGGEEASERSRH